ncbi:MAG: hypothetical protein J5851_01400 [Oscillospiraceae bacterium]|nr:hypothetical protein [Oscillospiraceae bacterium]
MKERSLRQLLQNADGSELERIAALTPMTDDKTKKRLQNAVQRRIAPDSFTPEAEETGDAKPIRHSFSTAFSAVAACLVIAGTAAGAFYLKQNAVPRIDPASEVSELSTEQLPQEIVQEETQISVDYDMTDKMGVLGKMLNSMDYYSQVSGEFVRNESDMVNGAGIVTFAVDLDAWTSNQQLVRGSLSLPAEEVLQGAEPDFAAIANYDANGGLRYYSEGSRKYCLFDDASGAWYRSEPGEAYDPDEAKVDPEALVQYDAQVHANGEQAVESFPYRATPANAYCVDCIYPVEYAEYLLDPDTWEITGEETFLERNCVVLQGRGTQSELDFTMYVDKVTGCLLWFESRYSSGELAEWLRVRSLAFDEDAAPVTDTRVGREEWNEQEHTTERPDDIPSAWLAYGTNSHGETYASAGQMRLVRGNYDQLPDLIRFGETRDEYGRRSTDCFVKKTELFELFGDDPDTALSRLMQAHNKTETAVPVAELKLYDIEGETVVQTVVYYDEP